MNKALETTANALAITSSLLAIGIELGIIGGGYYIYKKFFADPEPKKKEEPVVKVLASEDETDILPAKNTPKEKLRKVGAIVRAVLE